MNKQMRAILAKIETKTQEAEALLDAGKGTEAKALVDEIKTLREDYATAEELYSQQAAAAVAGEGKDPKGANGFKVMAKVVRRESLTEAEAALITSDDQEEHSENKLVPEDVDFTIREHRKQHKSAKDLVTVIPTSTMSGTFLFEADDDAELLNFTDGENIPEAENPKFLRKAWKIALKGALIIISNILKGVEKAGLMVYLDRWFIKKAIRTENRKIFTILKSDKAPKSLAGWEGLKRSINKDLDPSAKINGVIVTNQSGFNILDEAKDKNGRPILKENPADSTRKLFQSLPIEVFSDKELPNVDGAAPIFYGDLKAGCYFIDLLGYQFAVSEHFKFGQNATAMRVIEGFDVMQGDSDAYVYGLITPSMGSGDLVLLDVLSSEGSATGKTVVQVFPGTPAGYSAKYKTGASVTLPAYGDVISTGYTNLPTGDVTATAGNDIVVVYLDSSNAVMAAGKTTAVVKE